MTGTGALGLDVSDLDATAARRRGRRFIPRSTLRRGDGSASWTFLHAGRRPCGIALASLGGDGALDLRWQHRPDLVSRLSGDGAGGLGAPVTLFAIGVDASRICLAAADVTTAGSGPGDLGHQTDDVALFVADGAGILAPRLVPAAAGTRAVAVSRRDNRPTS
jgi:hypothetical protein